MVPTRVVCDRHLRPYDGAEDATDGLYHSPHKVALVMTTRNGSISKREPERIELIG